MGVTGLWTVVQPAARPIKLETLNRKRLAVDASIWIYQFLKAVRDKEGNALRNSHVVGFFRRICKLLFFGIQPVFVFDGGAPALKRETIAGRKRRREGRREDATRTAGKLLALQLQRRAEEDEQKRRDERDRPVAIEEEETIPENLVYVDELQMTPVERQRNRKFKKSDAYHLPDMEMSLSAMGAPNDPRVMSQEELEEYARQFNSGEDINLYDFSKIDFNSSFFLSLPPSDRYNILNAARLRSRLRMGLSKQQLDAMFPDRMAFSKFQIERVTERNELTQRLMNINGMNGVDAMYGVNGGSRIASERGREYVLVKNDGVEGGWALGVFTNNDEGKQDKPIDVDALDSKADEDEEGEWEDEDAFEDVPIQGLNRLPKQGLEIGRSTQGGSNEILRKRQAIYDARLKVAGHKSPKPPSPPKKQSSSLFIEADADGEWQDVIQTEEQTNDLFEANEDDEDLRMAIAMSLEKPSDDEDFEDVLVTNSNLENSKSGELSNSTIANPVYQRKRRPWMEGSASGSDDEMDLQVALAESRKKKRELKGTPDNGTATDKDTPSNPFDGPLPFEKLTFGSSLLGKRKIEEAGGFETDIEKVMRKDREAKEAPPIPWFSGAEDVRETLEKDKEFHGRMYPEGKDSIPHDDIVFLPREDSNLVIDVDQEYPSQSQSQRRGKNEVIDLEKEYPSQSQSQSQTQKGIIEIEVEPGTRRIPRIDIETSAEPVSVVEIGIRDSVTDHATMEVHQTQAIEKTNPLPLTAESPPKTQEDISDDEAFEWEDSDYERDNVLAEEASAVGNEKDGRNTKVSSPDVEFEDVPVPRVIAEVHKSPSPKFDDVQESAPAASDAQMDEAMQSPAPAPAGDSFHDEPQQDTPMEDEYSDPEDADLFVQLSAEAEEHARFAATLNSKSTLQSPEDYERELRQLRNQQKKDRRDADEVTQVMITECQQLLRLFGLPYVTAPMEAEAQCAEFVKLGLVDGIVTDDSDIFLFGGTRVYKNMFNQAKFVECYLMSDLEKEFNLDRRKLISLSHLLGSDYTEGLPSVGPVTALEILSEFATTEAEGSDDSDPLVAFASWWNTTQQSATPIPRKQEPTTFRRKFRKNLAKIFLPPTFPDPRVSDAYLHPEIDSDETPFAWGVPDLDALRAFLMSTIGWTQERTDEVLVPVVRDMNKREVEGTQSNITRYFSGGVGVGASGRGLNGAHGGAAKRIGGAGGEAGTEAFAPRRRPVGSKRMADALGKLKGAAKRRRIGAGVGAEGEDEGASTDGVVEVDPTAIDTRKQETKQKKGSRKKGKAMAKKARAATPVEDKEEESDSAGYNSFDAEFG